MDINNLFSGLSALATIVLAIAAFWTIWDSHRVSRIQGEQFNKQYFQAQEENRARVRPYLRPTYSNEDIAVLTFEAMNFFHLTNDGFGPGLNVAAVIFPPGPSTSHEAGDPRRLAQLHIPGIAPSESIPVYVSLGITSLPGSTILDSRTTHMLYAPPQPVSGHHPTLQVHPPAYARMTLSYQDVDGAKHGAIFDLHAQSVGGWRLVTYLRDIDRTLDELDAEYAATVYSQQSPNLFSAHQSDTD